MCVLVRVLFIAADPRYARGEHFASDSESARAHFSSPFEFATFLDGLLRLRTRSPFDVLSRCSLNHDFCSLTVGAHLSIYIRVRCIFLWVVAQPVGRESFSRFAKKLVSKVLIIWWMLKNASKLTWYNLWSTSASSGTIEWPQKGA